MLTDLNTAQLISRFNAIAGVKPVTAWKESKAKLIAKIEAAELAAIPAKPTKPAKIATTKSAKKVKAEPAPVVNGARHTVTDFCELHGLNAKVLRAKLRKLGFNAPYTNEQLATTLDK